MINLSYKSNSAVVNLHGATLTSLVLQDQKVIYLSPKAVLDGTRAIRGGIPLVFRKNV